MPPKKQRPNNFFEVGVQGRKTGITLEDKGIRDEYGLEPMDGIFSSPAKESPVRRSDPSPETTNAVSEDMDIQQSSAPEPSEALSHKKLARNSKTMLPPPRGKSPVKTHVGSSPRRQSTAPPTRTESSDPAAPSSSPHGVNRKLDFSISQDQRSNSAATPDSASKSAGRRKGAQRDASDVYNLPVSPERGHKRTFEESFAEEVEHVNGDDESSFDQADVDGQLLPQEDEESLDAAAAEDADDSQQQEEEYENEDEDNEEDGDEGGAVDGGAELDITQDDEEPAEEEQEVEEESEAAAPPPAKKKPGRKRKSDIEAKPSQQAEPQRVSKRKQAEQVTAKATRGRPGRKPKVIEPEAFQISEEPPKKKRGRQPGWKAAPKEAAPEVSENSQTLDASTISMEPSEIAPKKRGRPPKTAKTESSDEKPPQIKSSQPKSSQAESSKAMPPPATKGRPKKAKEAEEEKKYRRQIDAALGPSAMRGGSIPRAESYEESKSNVLLRSQTPFDDSFARSKYGRTIIPPVSYYLGERLEYGVDGTLQNIVKAEIAQQQQRTKRPGKRAGGGGRRKREIEEEEELEELEEWEKEEPGVLSGYVNVWDHEAGKETEQLDEMEIAMAHRAIQPREVANGDFSYARIFGGFPWFSNGIVKLPPSGVKRPKPSRKMHLVFFVVRGQVEVTVGNNVFKISRGGAFQVPRGNTYGIVNTSDAAEAELFFTQASQPTVETEG